MQPVTLAIDCMGSDLGPHVVVAAACQTLLQFDSLKLILVGCESDIRPVIHGFPKLAAKRYRIAHAETEVLMSDKPSHALRRKMDSSMALAVKLTAAGEADGCVSAGNTGALMAFSRRLLNMYPGIERPAITTALPNPGGYTRMLDLGANMECDSQTLFHFGVMGSVIAAAVDGVIKPRVGLLNIGVEDIKGNDQIKQAASLLESAASVHYIGFVEGNQIFTGDVDVVVCDGFTGNAVLKATEGLTRFFTGLVKGHLVGSTRAALLNWLVRPALRRFRDEINPDRYNGASFAGLDHVVVKSHGGANESAMSNAIVEAMEQVREDVPGKLWRALESIESNGE